VKVGVGVGVKVRVQERVRVTAKSEALSIQELCDPPFMVRHHSCIDVCTFGWFLSLILFFHISRSVAF